MHTVRHGDEKNLREYRCIPSRVTINVRIFRSLNVSVMRECSTKKVRMSFDVHVSNQAVNVDMTILGNNAVISTKRPFSSEECQK